MTSFLCALARPVAGAEPALAHRASQRLTICSAFTAETLATAVV